MNFREVKDALNSRVEDVVSHLLPAARRKGATMCVGSIEGEPGESLTVVISGKNRGVWKDWAAGGKPSDLFDLWRQVRGHASNSETMREVRGWLGIRDLGAKVKTGSNGSHEKAPDPPDPPDLVPLSGAALAYLKSRGISDQTLAAFKVKMSPDGQEVAFRYETPLGTYARTKFLNLDRSGGEKRVRCHGGSAPFLWGMWAVPDTTREVVVCEGEIDAMSWFEAGVPAVSVPDGAGSDGWIDRCYNWIGQFETLLISMDQDEKGQAATERIMRRLGHENCRVVSLPKKDANECLMSGVPLGDLATSASHVDPAEIVFGGDLAERSWETFSLGPRANRGVVLLDLDPAEFNFRLRPRELTVYTGYNGSGKSTLLYQIVAWLTAVRGETVFIGSYEEPCHELMGIIATQVAGARFTTDSGRDESMADTYNRTISAVGDRIVMHETEATIDYREFFDLARYAVRRYGASHVFLDSLTKTNVDMEDNAICKKFMDDACAFFQQTGAHLHVVAHPRKPQGIQFGGKRQRASKFDVKGSGILTDLAFNVISIYRPGPDEQSSWDAEITCEKQKVGGVIPPPLGLNFEADIYRFHRDSRTARESYLNHEKTSKQRDPF